MTRARRRRWGIGAAIAVLVAAAGVFLAFAAELGVERAFGIAPLLPARDAVTAGCGVLAVLAVALAFWHPSRPVALPLAAALLVVLGVLAPGLIARGRADPAPAPAGADQLRILEWNTNADLVEPSVIATLAVREHANIVVLPDAGIARTAPQYSTAFSAAGVPSVVFAAPGRAAQAAIVMTDALAADYRLIGAGPDLDKTLVLAPTVTGLPRVVAVHAPRPVPGGTTLWRETLSWVAKQCREGSVLAVGDFNASVDNFGGPRLGACHDVASAQGSGSVGTWPAALPTLVAMPIDHVLATPAAGTVLSYSVLVSEDRSGARHRPTFTVLRAR